MLFVVLTKYHIHKVVFVVHDRQRVKFVIPNDVVSFFERGICIATNKFFTRSHELKYRRIKIHTRKTIVTTRNNTKQFSLRMTAFGNWHSGVTVLFLKLYHVTQRCGRRKVGIATNKARLVILYATNHCSLLLNSLGTINK